MKYTGNYNLKKPDGTDAVNIDDLNSNMDIIDTEIKKINTNKVDKVVGKQLSTEDYTSAEKAKLAGIAANANNIALVNSLAETTAGKALDATQGKKLAGDISTLNASLSEIKQSDAKKLPLTGGTMIGVLKFLGDGSTTNLEALLYRWRDMLVFGTTSRQLRIDNNNGVGLVHAIAVHDSGNGVDYPLYGTHNITVSQSAPSSALAEGCQHQVY